MGDTQKIVHPKDLYLLHTENEYTEDQVNYLLTPLTDDDWKIINSLS